MTKSTIAFAIFFSGEARLTETTLRVQHINSKGKGYPKTGYKGPEGDHMYSSTLPLTSALD